MFKKTAFAVVATMGLVAFTAPSFAADLVIDQPEDFPPVTQVSGGADWEGPYIGGYVGGFPTDPSYYIGGQIGVNFLASESFLIGLQASGEISPNGGYMQGWLDAKAGVAFDMVAIYGIGGVGIDDGGNGLWRLGAGAEVMVADGVSIFGEAFGANTIGNPPNVPQLQAGFRFHF